MKIKLTTPNYVAFTGWIGDVQFADGTSVSDVTQTQAAFVSAMHTVEEVTPTGQEDGETTAEGQEVTSEEQKEAEEGAEEAEQATEQAEQAAQGDEAKE